MKTKKIPFVFFAILLYICMVHTGPLDGQIKRSGPQVMGYGGVFYIHTPNALIRILPGEDGLALRVIDGTKKVIKSEVFTPDLTLAEIAFTHDFKYLMLLSKRIVPDGYDSHAVKLMCLTEAAPEHLGSSEEAYPLFTAETFGREGLVWDDFGFGISTSKELGKFSISINSYKSGNLDKEGVIQFDPGDPGSIKAAFKAIKQMSK